MLFSRLKNKTEASASSEELDRETIARWKAIAAESREESKYQTIVLEEEVILPEAKSAQHPSGRSEQLSFSTSLESKMAEPEMETDVRASWPSRVEETELEEIEPQQAYSSYHVEMEEEEEPEEYFASYQEQDSYEEEIEQTEEQYFEEAEMSVTPSTPASPGIPRADLSLSAEEDIKRRLGDNVRSALGPGTVIDGTFRFDSPVCVDGTLTGEIISSSVLIVGPHAEVQASVIVGSLIVQGSIIGDIEADELVELRAGADVQGNIETRRIVIEDGAVFSGKCRMLG